METIVKRIKDTRDSNFETVDKNGVTVNRTGARLVGQFLLYQRRELYIP